MTELQLWAYREQFVCWAGDPTDLEALLDNDHPTDLPCDWGWMCNAEDCLTRVDDQPCPTHAPIAVPGLRLVECTAEPRHYVFTHDRDDYGGDCPVCWIRKLDADLRPLQQAAERHKHRWCWALNRLKEFGRRVGLVRIEAYYGSNACWHVEAKWRWVK